MAEIGLVASIFSVVAVGTSVATTLYEVADIMINANQQIFVLAKHVSQFTAVLKNLGQVLETEKANCSKEAFRNIRSIKHSCKRTFREINSTVKSKRSHHLVPVRWLFKRTKALELGARLESQQSMLQCMIYTLTVSRLSHIDLRSKQDSEHITGLTAEIKLLKTFIKESYNNLTELRRAEQSTESEAQHQPIPRSSSYSVLRHPHGDSTSSALPPNSMSGSTAYERPTPSFPSPTSSAIKCDDEDSNSENSANDDDASSTKSDKQNDVYLTGPAGDTLNPEPLISRLPSQPRSSINNASKPSIHRESNLLFQMVPYRPNLPDPNRSDRLICGGQSSDSGTKLATHEATNSVRLLLDKWTASGSAPVSNILDEEVGREKNEAELADKRWLSHPNRPDNPKYRRPILSRAKSNGDFGPTHDPGRYESPRRFQDDHMPPPPSWDNLQPHYGHRLSHQKDFWVPLNTIYQPAERQIGGEILSILRSMPGGIHYTKSNQFEQVHYVDQCIIYICSLVPRHMILHHRCQYLNTELDRGLIRKAALDLLGYSYTETETGKFSIVGDLQLIEIEDLVRLSYQALDRNLKESSRKAIKEEGLGEAINAMYDKTQGLHSATPLYHPLPIPKSWNQNNSSPDLSEEAMPDFRAREPSSPRRRARPITSSPPIKPKYWDQDGPSTLVSAMRFKLQRKTHNELQNLRKRLVLLTKRKDEAEKVEDVTTAADLNHVILDVQSQIKNLEEQEQERHAASMPRSEKDKKSYHIEAETESESSDDEAA